MFLTELLATVFFLWVVMKYPTPLHIAIGLALSLYLGGTHVNPAITFMKYLGGQMSQKSFITLIGAQLLAGWIVLTFLR